MYPAHLPYFQKVDTLLPFSRIAVGEKNLVKLEREAYERALGNPSLGLVAFFVQDDLASDFAGADPVFTAQKRLFQRAKQSGCEALLDIEVHRVKETDGYSTSGYLVTACAR